MKGCQRVSKVLLDSTAYIDLVKALKHRRDAWASNTITNSLNYRNEQGSPFLSVVTVVEILHGLHKDIANPGKAPRFKKTAPAYFQFLEVTADIGYLASKIIAKLEIGRQSIGFPDTLIAATAIHHGLTLVTANTRHFPRVIAAGFPLTLANWRDA